MEHLSHWIAKNRERRFGSLPFGVGMLATMPLMIFGPATMTFGMTDPPQATMTMVGMAILAAAGWTPFFLYRHRHRSDLGSFIVKASRGHLAETMGEHAGILNEAAGEWEQIDLLSRKGPVPAELRKEIRREANRRMERAFDLATAPPALHGFARDDADGQIATDARWLAQTRAEIERATLSSGARGDASDPLLQLRALANEREAALDELRE